MIAQDSMYHHMKKITSTLNSNKLSYILILETNFFQVSLVFICNKNVIIYEIKIHSIWFHKKKIYKEVQAFIMNKISTHMKKKI